MRSEIIARAGDNALTSTQIDRWINLSIKQWATRSSWPENIAMSTTASVSGTQEYTLPTDIKRALMVKTGTTEPDASELGYVDFNSKDSAITGYYLNPVTGMLGIIPTPTSVQNIYLKYYKTPADLTIITEEPPFPEDYHELCIFFALKKYWEMTDDFGKSNYYDSEYENMINQMKIDLPNIAVGSLPVMRDIRDFSGSSTNHSDW